MKPAVSSLDFSAINRPLALGVLMGGRGCEREVSFNSGRTVCDHLDIFRYTIIPIFQRANGSLYILPYRFLHRGKTSDFEHRLDTEAEKITWDSLKERINFMCIALHGRYAEDGTVQGFLEVLGIPYLGSKVLASALSMNKIFQKKMLQQCGISVPRGIALEVHEIGYLRSEQLDNKLKAVGLTYPLIVKPSHEGSSLGISFVSTFESLQEAIVKASCIDNRLRQDVLIEEYVQGMEFSCIIITDYKQKKYVPLPPTEIIPEKNTFFLDYEQKYMPGRSTKFTPVRSAPDMIAKIQDTCVRVAEVLSIENIARIDGFVTPENTIVIIDPNTLSGMAPSSYLFRQAAEINMSHTALINHLIETELDRYGLLSLLERREKKERNSMNNPLKKRIAVLLGGRSHEREISLESGRNVFYKLSPHKYEPIALFVDENLELYRLNQSFLVRNSTKELQDALTSDMKVLWNDLPTVADFVFIGLHGAEGENGAIQGALEMLGLPYNGSSVLASALCMDKYKTNQFLKSEGFDVPNSYLIDHKRWFVNKAAELAAAKITPFPLIVKPHDDGCSVLVAKVRNDAELEKAIETIFSDGKRHAMVEEYMVGMELTVGVIGNNKIQALPPSYTVSTNDVLSIEEKFLPGAGENQTPAPLSALALSLVKNTMEKAYKALNCRGYARIDCFYQNAQQSPTGNERVILLECNTLPGLTPATCIFHQAAEIGIKPMEFIDLIIQFGYEQYAAESITSEVTQKKVILSDSFQS